MRRVLLLAVLAALACLEQAAPAARPKELFLDAAGLEAMSGLEIELHSPQPAGHRPLVTPDRPWESRMSFYNSVVDNGTHVHLYYDVTIQVRTPGPTLLATR